MEKIYLQLTPENLGNAIIVIGISLIAYRIYTFYNRRIIAPVDGEHLIDPNIPIPGVPGVPVDGGIEGIARFNPFRLFDAIIQGIVDNF